MSAIVPNPPPTPRITVTSMRPSAHALSCIPTAVTAFPGARSMPPRPAPGRPPKPPTARWKWRAAGAVALAALAAGLHLGAAAPRKPQIVSGRAGPKMSTSGEPERWHQGQVTVTLDGSLDDLSPGAREAVQQAFGAWLSTSAKLPQLTFDSRKRAPILLEPDGENRVYYAPIPVPGHENDLAITLSFTDEATGEILEADIVVNSKHQWGLLTAPTPAPDAAPHDDAAPTTGQGGGPENRGASPPGGHGPSASSNGAGDKGASGHGPGAPDPGRSGGNGASGHGPSSAGSGESAGASPSGDAPAPAGAHPTTTKVAGCTGKYDLASVATHEIGHFFGLGEDMTDPTAAMYFSTPPCNVGKRQLKVDDTQEVSTLYARPVGDSASGTSGAAAGVKSCSVSTLGGGTGHAAHLASVALLGLAALGRRRRRV